MKACAFLIALMASLVLVAVPSVALAGIEGGTPGVVPEPTAMLVWMGLAGAGGLFFWRQNRDSE